MGKRRRIVRKQPTSFGGIQTRSMLSKPCGQNALGEIYFCWGVDQDEWNARNRVPMGPERENRWLIRIVKHSMSEQEAKNHVRYVFEWNWFGLWGGDEGRAEIKEIRVVGSPSEVQAEFGSPIKTWDQVDGPAITWDDSNGNPSIWVFVRFVYRGSLSDFPWATYRGGSGFLNYPNWNCPKDVTVGLHSAYKPAQKKEEEDPCSVPGAWGKNPDCNPITPIIKPSSWPWWIWAAGGAAVLWFTWPILLPVVQGAVSARSALKSRSGGGGGGGGNTSGGNQRGGGTDG